MKKWLWVLIAVVLLLGSWYALNNRRPPLEWTRSPDQVVFEIDEGGGGPLPHYYPWLHLPSISVFGDGRVLFTQGQSDSRMRSLRVAYLPEEKLRHLLEKADRTLAKAKPHNYRLIDGGATWFTLVTSAGTRQFSTQCITCGSSRALAVLEKAFRDELMSGSNEYVPDDVIIVAIPTSNPSQAALEWPDGLGTPLPEGSPNLYVPAGTAKALVERHGIAREKLYRYGDREYRIEVVPRVPKLHTF